MASNRNYSIEPGRIMESHILGAATCTYRNLDSHNLSGSSGSYSMSSVWYSNVYVEFGAAGQREIMLKELTVSRVPAARVHTYVKILLTFHGDVVLDIVAPRR